jgi:hypothetical protein
MPEACFVFGEVFWSQSQVSALLSSNCPIHIERTDHRIVMKGPGRTVNVRIPKDPGVHEFVYRWGQSFVRLDDEKVQVAWGPVVEQTPSSLEKRTGSDF